MFKQPVSAPEEICMDHVPLKDKRIITIIDAFQKHLYESNRKLNKV